MSLDDLCVCGVTRRAHAEGPPYYGNSCRSFAGAATEPATIPERWKVKVVELEEEVRNLRHERDVARELVKERLCEDLKRIAGRELPCFIDQLFERIQ